ncbi:hypothetical protein K144316041_23180 [Clostridium tetani]|uniref:hypothetical protein n=1 Tax=Clostridium tetani TaxID=1513 RepID=UPI002953D0DA|nr:hypothetical protein [Clostridium tetani]BDR73610.1 hypothetical protein K144316041_23180 [Clostridium tetani]
MKDTDTWELIKKNVQRLIDKKIIKDEKNLENLMIDQVEKIADELDICIIDIICCYCPFENCINECKNKI